MTAIATRIKSSVVARLKGSVPPLITPFTDGEVDYATYERLVARQVEQGSHGILINGTSGEPSTLTVDERNRLLDIAMRVANRRIPVVAATGSQSFAETRALTEHAVTAGVDALLIVTPYYIRPPQRGLVAYYLELAKLHDLPWMIYHIPGRAAINVTLETLQEIAEKSPTFVGMKHAVNDLGLVSDCLGAFGELFRIFVGLEELSWPMMAVGACGVMNAVGNLAPDLMAEMCECVWRNDLAAGRALHQRLWELNKSIFYETNPIPVKYMMRRLGLLENDEHRLPMLPASPELAKRLDGVLLRAGLLK